MNPLNTSDRVTCFVNLCNNRNCNCKFCNRNVMILVDDSQKNRKNLALKNKIFAQYVQDASEKIKIPEKIKNIFTLYDRYTTNAEITVLPESKNKQHFLIMQPSEPLTIIKYDRMDDGFVLKQSYTINEVLTIFKTKGVKQTKDMEWYLNDQKIELFNTVSKYISQHNNNQINILKSVVVISTKPQKSHKVLKEIKDRDENKLSTDSSEKNIDSPYESIIYLLQTARHKESKITNNIYKIGRSKHFAEKRMAGYDKGSHLLLSIVVPSDKNVTIEKDLIGKFKDKFRHATEVGNEYFEGNYKEMIMIIYEHCKHYYEQTIITQSMSTQNIQLTHDGESIH